ncbi:MAG: hypothetical protein ABIE94_05980 [archaeon]
MMFEFLQNLGIMATLKSKVDEFLEDLKERVKESVERMVKSIIIGILVFIGFIFALVGFARYLTETFPGLDHGLGYVVVGLILIFIGIIAKVFSR